MAVGSTVGDGTAVAVGLGGTTVCVAVGLGAMVGVQGGATVVVFADVGFGGGIAVDVGAVVGVGDMIGLSTLVVVAVGDGIGVAVRVGIGTLSIVAVGVHVGGTAVGLGVTEGTVAVLVGMGISLTVGVVLDEAKMVRVRDLITYRGLSTSVK
ncbi:MAG: hypothetical protein C4584_02710 [Armatimonadetes bacterium]|nr:MAG: hypothetical protein C4584_02710 [Armatimonadota bacterium]